MDECRTNDNHQTFERIQIKSFGKYQIERKANQMERKKIKLEEKTATENV